MRIDSDVEQILIDSRVEGQLLFLPHTQLERQLYLKVNKALEAIGGTWNRKQKAHLFDYDPADAIEQIVLTGEFIDPKKEFQFFETPPEIAKQLVEMACIEKYDYVLEPSAGHGAIAQFLPLPVCAEINPKCQDVLKERGWPVVAYDFLKYQDRHDVIVANPPFSKQQDIDHVNHMLDIADKRVVSVMSGSVLFRDNKKTIQFRDRISKLGGCIEPLPDGAFKSSGTNVRTCVVKVDLT